MQAVAKVKNVRYGVRKLRRVVDLVRGKRVDEAFAMLSIMHTQTKGAPIVENALKSAVANFKQFEIIHSYRITDFFKIIISCFIFAFISDIKKTCNSLF